MPENPHDKKDLKKKREKPSAEPEKKPDENGAWGEDQKKKGYYYDDAHGYEIFTDEADEES
jgi:hypothetical protein